MPDRKWGNNELNETQILERPRTFEGGAYGG